ncbi:MAG: hypothetical protein DHS80DRAFT_25058 [Piptocephalis tieghemiana]|nr:MAG: hypothetical protein DHS80DRAFT_25058 [Piptocephalis tieghemiana]
MKLLITVASLAILLSVIAATETNDQGRRIVCGECTQGQKSCHYQCDEGLECPAIVFYRPCSGGGDYPTSTVPPMPLPSPQWVCGPCVDGEQQCHPYCAPGQNCIQIVKTRKCGYNNNA